jgi:hypothetical protein
MLDKVFHDADVKATEALGRLQNVIDFGTVREDALSVARGLKGNQDETVEAAEIVLGAVRKIPDPLERLPLLEELADEAAGKSDYLSMNAVVEWRDVLGKSLPVVREYSAYGAFVQAQSPYLKRAAAQAVLDYHDEVEPGVASKNLFEVEKFAIADKNFALKEEIEAALNELPIHLPKHREALPGRNPV